MPKLVVLITPQTEEGHRIAEAWQEAGAPGVTFVESYGIRRLQESTSSFEVLPGMMSMMEILRSQEQHNLMFFSVVHDDNTVDNLISASEAILGDLTEPNNGVLFVMDVERWVGVGRRE